MNINDKNKLKVLIKFILIQKSPKLLSANQISSIINSYKWGFSENVTSSKIGRLLLTELKKSESHFLDCIKTEKGKNNILLYYYSGE